MHNTQQQQKQQALAVVGRFSSLLSLENRLSSPCHATPPLTLMNPSYKRHIDPVSVPLPVIRSDFANQDQMTGGRGANTVLGNSVPQHTGSEIDSGMLRPRRGYHIHEGIRGVLKGEAPMRLADGGERQPLGSASSSCGRGGRGVLLKHPLSTGVKNHGRTGGAIYARQSCNQRGAGNLPGHSRIARYYGIGHARRASLCWPIAARLGVSPPTTSCGSARGNRLWPSETRKSGSRSPSLGPEALHPEPSNVSAITGSDEYFCLIPSVLRVA
jgi:hypothetical protein